MPRVSVIMGVYNGEKKLRTSIESILNQTFCDFEFIICDDASTDKSLEIIRSFAEIDSRIKVLYNERNLGLAETLNKCLEVARGEYIARMDDDDISHPCRFEEQVRFLDSNNRYSIVGVSRNLYDDDGVWGTSISNGERKKIDIFLGRSFTHPSVMMRRSALIDVKGYTTGWETERAEDYDLWCKLYSNGYHGYNISDVLFNYYESRSSFRKRKYKYRIREYRLRRKWRKKLGLPLRYSIYVYRPLLVGLLPKYLLFYLHKRRFNSYT